MTVLNAHTKSLCMTFKSFFGFNGFFGICSLVNANTAQSRGGVHKCSSDLMTLVGESSSVLHCETRNRRDHLINRNAVTRLICLGSDMAICCLEVPGTSV